MFVRFFFFKFISLMCFIDLYKLIAKQQVNDEQIALSIELVKKVLFVKNTVWLKKS